LFLRKKTYDTTGSLSKLAWKRFLKNRIAFSALLFIGLVAFIATIGYWITPDKTPMVNEQNLLLATLKPGSSVPVLRVCKNQDIPESNILYRLLYGQANRYSDFPYTNYRFSGDSVF
jgi:peptide/nickel transport system permease protein